MTLPSKPLTTIGDAAILLIQTAANQYDLTPPVLPSFGRILRSSTALGAYDVRNAGAQGCFFRIVSVLESYTDAALEAMFRKVVPASSPAATRLLESHLLDATQRWESRKSSYAEHHGLRLADMGVGFPQWPKVDGMIQVRNAIAHGLGSLTRQQRRKPIRTAGRCSQIGVRIAAGEVLVDRTSIQSAARVAGEFVGWLDERLL